MYQWKVHITLRKLPKYRFHVEHILLTTAIIMCGFVSQIYTIGKSYFLRKPDRTYICCRFRSYQDMFGRGTLLPTVATFINALFRLSIDDLARPHFRDDRKVHWSHKEHQYTLATISGDTQLTSTLIGSSGKSLGESKHKQYLFYLNRCILNVRMTTCMVIYKTFIFRTRVRLI